MAHELPLSVTVALPPEFEELIRRRIAAAEAQGMIEAWTTVIHGALWQMRNREKTKAGLRAEIDAAILEGLNSGPAIRVTPKFWKDLKAGGRERMKRIREARANGLVGNLLLPQELFSFVQGQVSCGRFASLTDVVCEALRFMEEQVDR